MCRSRTRGGKWHTDFQKRPYLLGIKAHSLKPPSVSFGFVRPAVPGRWIIGAAFDQVAVTRRGLLRDPLPFEFGSRPNSRIFRYSVPRLISRMRAASFLFHVHASRMR